MNVTDIMKTLLVSTLKFNQQSCIINKTYKDYLKHQSEDEEKGCLDIIYENQESQEIIPIFKVKSVFHRKNECDNKI